MSEHPHISEELIDWLEQAFGSPLRINSVHDLPKADELVQQFIYYEGMQAVVRSIKGLFLAQKEELKR